MLQESEDEEVIEKILKHLRLWEVKARHPPKVKAPSATIPIDDSDSQVPFSAPPFYQDPDYPMDSYVSSRWILFGRRDWFSHRRG
jgi:hypothetical protein